MNHLLIPSIFLAPGEHDSDAPRAHSETCAVRPAHDTLAASPPDAASNDDEGDEGTRLGTLLDGLDALELLAEHRADSAANDVGTFEAAQCALCLASVRDTLAELHARAFDPREDAITSSYAAVAYRACAARVEAVLAEAWGGAPSSLFSREEPPAWRDLTKRVRIANASSLYEQLTRVRGVTAALEESLTWLQSHLPSLL
jgi:hypothetical protein